MQLPSKSRSKRTPTSLPTGLKQNDDPQAKEWTALSKLSSRTEYQIKFSRMTKEDIPAIAELEILCFSQPWSEQAFEAELQNKHAIFYVAKSGDKLAGYIGMHHVLDEGYIANVAVHPDFRRRGVATALIGRLLLYAKRSRMTFLTLEVREGNAAAIDCYKQLGFGEVGRRKGYYANPTEDAVLMTLFL